MLEQLLPLEEQYQFQIYPFKYQGSELFEERQQWIQRMEMQCKELGIENRKYLAGRGVMTVKALKDMSYNRDQEEKKKKPEKSTKESKNTKPKN